MEVTELEETLKGLLCGEDSGAILSDDDDDDDEDGQYHHSHNNDTMLLKNGGWPSLQINANNNDDADDGGITTEELDLARIHTHPRAEWNIYSFVTVVDRCTTRNGTQQMVVVRTGKTYIVRVEVSGFAH